MSLDAIGIVSENIQESVRFYKMLGVCFSGAKEDSGHLEGEIQHIRIMLDSSDLMRKLNPKWVKPKGSGVILCFKQDTPEKVDELYRQIVEAGFKGFTPPYDAFWGQRYSSVLDPDGNQIDIFASL